MEQVLGIVLAILIAAGILAALAVGACAAGAWWLRRMWRRRRVALALRLGGLVAGAIAAGGQWLRTRLVPDRRFWILQRARRELLRALGGAEHAVREAKEAKAPIGDLDGLTRRLRTASLDVDRSLRIAQRSDDADPLDALLDHASELTQSCVRIQRAAAASLAESHRYTDELVHHVRREEQAILRRATR